MKKRIVGLLLITAMVLSVFLSACGGQQSSPPATESEGQEQEAAEPIKIGHEVALTGDASMWGQSEKNALDMEIEKINAAGGVDGRPLKLISYDNRADAVEAVNVAKRLIE